MNKPDPIDLTLQANAWTDSINYANCRSLASIITKLVNENEPLLKAECDGATVTVRERGGPAVMRLTVETDSTREAGEPNKQPAANNER